MPCSPDTRHRLCESRWWEDLAGLLWGRSRAPDSSGAAALRCDDTTSAEVNWSAAAGGHLVQTLS